MQLSLLTWLLALSPVLVVLVLMLGLKWGGSKAGAASWFAALLVAMVFFGAGPLLIAYSQVKAILLTLDVLYIIWAALLLFHIVDEAGAVRIIGQSLPGLTANRTMQGLLLGWLFASFLQGMGGFGVPVAVAAPLLVGLGFNPVQAVLMACLGHGWAVNFGSLATSFQTLMAVTGLPGPLLAPDAGVLLGFSSFVCGALVAFVASGWKGLRQTLPVVALLSLVMGITQYFLVTHHLWTLGATGAATAGLLVGIALARLPAYRKAHLAVAPDDISAASSAEGVNAPRSVGTAMSAYLVLVVLAFALILIQPVNAFLSRVTFNLMFPAMQTSLGFTIPAEAGRKITIFSHPGAILIYTSLISILIYSFAGYFKPGAARRIADKVARGAVNSSLGIIAMVGMAVIMSSSGMTNLLAQGLSQAFGQVAYPLIAPFIGALGAFITGSNNNSNVLFAVLQMRTAELLKLSVPLILAAQTAGGSLGSVMAPAKVIVGCSTVGLGDNEGAVIGRILYYGSIPVAVVAIITLLMVLLNFSL
jgi:lactate permease